MFLLKPFALFTFLATGVTVIAQQKQLTDDQYFKGNFKGIVQSLPMATRWTDNSHFLLIRGGKSFVVDAKNGKEREANDADKNVPKVVLPPSPYIKDKDVFLRINDVKPG